MLLLCLKNLFNRTFACSQVLTDRSATVQGLGRQATAKHLQDRFTGRTIPACQPLALSCVSEKNGFVGTASNQQSLALSKFVCLVKHEHPEPYKSQFDTEAPRTHKVPELYRLSHSIRANVPSLNWKPGDT